MCRRCIFGLMLASEYVADGQHPNTEFILTQCTLVVLVVSMLYFTAVLWHELVAQVILRPRGIRLSKKRIPRPSLEEDALGQKTPRPRRRRGVVAPRRRGPPAVLSSETDPAAASSPPAPAVP